MIHAISMVYPRHRLPGPALSEETTMSKPALTKVELTPEQRRRVPGDPGAGGN